jgi:cell wall-associated NlpC family hydrolase
LVVLVYRSIGVELPSYSEEYASTEDKQDLAALIQNKREDSWKEVPLIQAKPLDTLLIREMGVPSHVALVVGKGRMLHMITRSSVIASYLSPIYNRRVAGCFRYVGRQGSEPVGSNAGS